MELVMRKLNLKNRSGLLLISASWVVVGTTIIWHVIVLIWVIYYTLNPTNLYIPESVKLTSYSLIAVSAWALIVFLLNIVWSKYNNLSSSKQLRLKTNSQQPIFIGKGLSWSEAVITKVNSYNILAEAEKVKNNLAIVSLQNAMTNFPASHREPHKLLNTAMMLIKKGQIVNGVSILRIIIEHPESSPLIKEVAKVKLSKCLHELGYKDLANGFVEKAI